MALLRDELRNNFHAAAARMGFRANETTFDMSHPAFVKKEVRFGCDPDKADIIGAQASVQTIADLKKMAGLVGLPQNKNINYPEPLADVLREQKENAKKGLAVTMGRDPVLDDNIKIAAAAYMVGDVQRVADYEALVNNYLFPADIVRFVSEELTVDSGQTVVLGTSGKMEMYDIGVITVKKGGSIRIVGNTQVTAQRFVQE